MTDNGCLWNIVYKVMTFRILAGVAAIASGALFGQPTFDVASVKPAGPANRGADFRVYPGGRLRITNLNLDSSSTP
jgi:hypothetical protein